VALVLCAVARQRSNRGSGIRSDMATYQCPKGHISTDPTYCSECGALIGASTISRAAPATPASAPGVELCPDCQTPRVPGARYCEVCRHDFESGSPSGASSPSSTAPSSTAPSSTAPSVASAPPSAATTGQANVVATGADNAPPVASGDVDAAAGSSAPPSTSAIRLNIVVVTDPSLAEDDETRKQCPVDAPELVFPLDLDETLVGRRSDARKIFPEIDLDDPGVSHRQLKLLRQPDGSFAALELGSANGTTLNGVALKPGLVTPVAAGDELVVGMWTRLQLRRR
jgi:FHA domain